MTPQPNPCFVRFLKNVRFFKNLRVFLCACVSPSQLALFCAPGGLQGAPGRHILCVLLFGLFEFSIFRNMLCFLLLFCYFRLASISPSQFGLLWRCQAAPAALPNALLDALWAAPADDRRCSYIIREFHIRNWGALSPPVSLYQRAYFLKETGVLGHLPDALIADAYI